MQIVMKNINELIPYVNNARKNDHAVDAVASSIKNYGFKQPIVIDSQGEVVAGHTRLKAAKKLNMEQVPCIIADDLTPAQIKAYRIADNKVAELSEWDMELLKVELKDIEGFTGFEVDELENLFEEEAKEENFDVEEALNEIIEPITKRGYIYKLGNHRLLCGDSTNEEDVARLMNGQKADMVFTDPPYGYSYQSNFQKNFSMLKNDDQILNFIPVLYKFMDNNSCVFLCGSHQTIDQWKQIVEKYFTYKNLIVWKKNSWSMGDLDGSFAGQHELIIFAHKGRITINGERSRDIWEFDREPPKVHPTQKPIDLINFALEKTTKKEDKILDLFGGSGSTLIACEQTKRNCFMMELDEKYCDVIVKRWEDYTGLKAERIE